MNRPFKNLLYVGDVAVEQSHGGSLLLWRLLETWPADKLAILEFCSHRRTDKELSNTKTYPVPLERLSRSRFRKLHSEWLTRFSGQFDRSICEVVDEHHPEAILSVAHGWSWIHAFRVAKVRNIPFYLWIHDDFPSFHSRAFGVDANERIYSEILPQCNAVFCISNAMRNWYEKKYPANYETLLPFRSFNQSSRPTTHRSGMLNASSPTIVYAGSIHSKDVSDKLISLARLMEDQDFGFLKVLAQGFPDDQKTPRRLEFLPMVPSQKVIGTLLEAADFLLLLMSFDPKSEKNMRFCFPSKLVDYSATGIPILFWGPSYGSGIEWGKELQDDAVVSTSQDPRTVLELVKQIADNESRWLDLAGLTLDRGNRSFDYSSNFERFRATVEKCV